MEKLMLLVVLGALAANAAGAVEIAVPYVPGAMATVTANGVKVAVLEGGGNVLVNPGAAVEVDYATVGDWTLSGMTHFEGVACDGLVLPAENLKPDSIRPVSYMVLETNETYGVVFVEHVTNAIAVTSATSVFSNGWYFTTGVVACVGGAGIDVAPGCTANLILTDGSSLLVTGYMSEDGDTGTAGIDVSMGETLNIFGQCDGTGVLTVTGGCVSAGIGGSGAGGNCGMVTINGGTVMATGGWGCGGAGIGGGAAGMGGTVTINGGAVMAKGGNTFTEEYLMKFSMVMVMPGAGIGGGWMGEGGTLMINGGTTVVEEGKDGVVYTGTLTLDTTRVKTVDGGKGPLGENRLKVVEIPPTCKEGMIAWSDAANAWVVTLINGATTVTVSGPTAGKRIAVPPTVRQVKGVADNQVKVWARVTDGEGAVVTHDITGAFTVADGAIRLNPEGEVNGVKVKPTIGDLDEGEPFAVGEGSLAVTVKAIPGLKYTLRRAESLSAPVAEDGDGTVESGDGTGWGEVMSEVATRTTVTLKDAEPPAGAAFYTIGVSLP